MILSTLLDSYFSLNLRIRNEHTRTQYRIALDYFGRFLGHAPTTEDLSDDNVARWMLWLVTVKGRSPVTANDRRTQLHALWTWLAKRGVVTTWPTTPPLDVPETIPDAWSKEELDQLMRACRSYRGCIQSVPLNWWWTAFHCVMWDTGERTKATLSLRWEWLDMTHGILRVPANVRKGGRKPALYRLTVTTLAVLEEQRKECGLMFPCGASASSFYHRYETLLRKANLPRERHCKPQKMRRTYASWIAALGGDATRALMHSSPDITQRHYIDPTILRRAPENRVLWPLWRRPDAE